MEKFEIITQDGTVDCYTAYPAGAGRYPAIILYMDAVGIRQGMFDMAKILSDEGYYVIVPNLYYRAGNIKRFDPKTAFSEEAERERIMSAIMQTTISNVMSDTRSILDYLKSEPHVKGPGAGCVGYCMGGKFALSAAAFYPETIAAAASIHGGSLATDKPESPHLLAGKIKAEIYVGVAGIDRGFSDEEKNRLDSALKNAGLKYTIEVYPEAMHGFAVVDMPVYKQDSADLHLRRLKDLFKRNL